MNKGDNQELCEQDVLPSPLGVWTHHLTDVSIFSVFYKISEVHLILFKKIEL